MTQFIAYNCALESASTSVTAGASYAAGAKVALQLGVPTGGTILVKEFGWTQDAATALATNVVLRTTATASTMTTAHSTTTIKPVDTNNVNAGASRLTMSTTTTGYGNGAVTSATTIRALRLYAPQQYVYQFALGDEWEVGVNASELLQLIVNTTATVNGLCWIKWVERI